MISEGTFQTLIRDLEAMELKHDAVLMVHSSMKKIGRVEGGAETVLNVLRSYLEGEGGLLVLPAFSYDRLCGRNNPFHKEKTKSCTGILSELFRQSPGVERSCHPTHSLSACGRDAAAFIADHQQYLTAFDRRGPFGRLLARNAKVLLAGVTLDRATFLHAVEEWSLVPVLSRKPLPLYIWKGQGEEPVSCPVHWHKGAHSEMYDCAFDLLLNGGALKKVKFGFAESLLLDCRKCFEIMNPVLRQDPDYFFNKDCPPQEE